MNLIFKNFTILNEDEKRAILELRNDENIRKFMHTSDKISLTSHLNWIKNLANDESKIYYALIYEQKIAGSLNLVDISDKKASFGLYFSPKINPLASSLSTCIFLDEAFKNFELSCIYAEVLKTNQKAINFDKNLGFKEYKNDDKYLYLSLEKSDFEKAKKEKLAIIFKKISQILYTFKD